MTRTDEIYTFGVTISVTKLDQKEQTTWCIILGDGGFNNFDKWVVLGFTLWRVSCSRNDDS